MQQQGSKKVRDMPSVTRRSVLEGGVAGGAMLLFPANAVAATSDSISAVPIPPQVPVTEGLAALPGTRLWYWDTGGGGQPVVLMHPASVSSEIWLYQQPVFAEAGYRVIAYSRRGYFRSDPVPEENPGHRSVDLGNLLDFLDVERCHLVASAAGCQVALDFALSNPQHLFSLTLSSGTGGISDEGYVRMLERIRPPGFDEMPVEFRELSPSYRAADPEGTARWKVLAEAAVTGNRNGQPNVNRIDWAALEQMTMPMLLIGGEADLYMPPPLLRIFLSHLPDGELVTIPEAGHSAYWEQPQIFNQTVLDFLSRHAA